MAEVEGHLRALLRDVLCGYLDADLKGVADDILLESDSEPFMDSDTQDSEVQEIEARDLRKEPRFDARPTTNARPRRTSTSIPSRVEPEPDSSRARLEPSSSRARHRRARGGDRDPSP